MVLQNLRNRAGLTQKSLAQLIGVSEQSIYYWESGLTYPKADGVKKLLEIYVEKGAFPAGKEVDDAYQLWEQLRKLAPRFKGTFDRDWFNNVLEAKIRHVPLPELNANTPNNLPPRQTSFVGRQKDLTELTLRLKPGTEATQPVRLVTLTGSGGTGKTSLALQVIRNILNYYPQGVWLIELAALTSPDYLLEQIATTLGLQEQVGISLLNTLINFLSEKQLLLVLDNCEHLVTECRRVVDRLLTNCPRLVVLTTSRQSLSVSGELVYRVSSLSLPPQTKDPLKIKELLEYDAIQLFVERSHLVDPNFSLNQNNAQAVTQLCQRLDGIPLALELAAARLKLLSVFQINDRLEDRLGLLSKSNQKTRPQHQTLRALLEWSHELLSEEEQLLFRRLSVFAGGSTLGAAEQVCAFGGLAQAVMLDTLEELVDKSLLSVQPSGNQQLEMRYSMLDTIREYAREQLRKNELEEKTTCDRHLNYFTTLLIEIAPKIEGAEAEIALSILDAEYNDIRNCFQWISKPFEIKESQDAAEFQNRLLKGLELGKNLKTFYDIRGYQTESREILQKLLEQTKASGLAKTTAYAWVLYTVGFLAQQQTEYQTSRKLAEEALRIFTELDHKYGCASTWNLLGNTLTYLGQSELANQYLHSALTLNRELADTAGIATALAHLGFTISQQNDLMSGAQYFRESLALWRTLENASGNARCLYGLGNIALRQGNLNQASQYLEESLAFYNKIGDKPGYSNALKGLSHIAFVEQNYDKTIYYLQQSLNLDRELGNKFGIGQALSLKGLVAQQKGDFVAASGYYYDGLVIARQLEDNSTIGVCLGNLGLLDMEQGQYDSARTYFKESVYHYQLAGQRLEIVYNLVAFSNLALRQAQLSDLSLQRQQLLTRATQLGGMIDAFVNSTGNVITEPEGTIHKKTLETLRGLLSQNDYQIAYTEGQRMTYEEGIEYALRDYI
ncbi:MAG: hypothetical protein BGO39_12145 [Chloroflexi bacterium 54-19]|nr:MAG: hypothetical protein BGO39_12145 [Chloroflexi bacterium 54-19]